MNDTTATHDTNLANESISDLLNKIAADSASLVRAEVNLAKQEIGKKMVDLQYGIILLAAGAVFGLVAFMAFCAAVVIAISMVTGPGIAVFVVGVLLTCGAVIAALMGLSHVRKAS